MKRIHFLIVVLSLVCVTFLFSGVSSAAQAVKPVTLRFADTVPEKSFYGDLHKWWASEVEKRTGGKIKIQIFWMESLVKWKDMLEGVQSGMADAGGVVAGGLCINTDVWKKIPKNQQTVLLKLRHDYGIRYAQKTMDLEAVLYKEWQTKHGVKVQYPTPEDQKIIQAAGLKANADLIKKQVSEGHAASQTVWDYYQAALKKNENARAKKR